MRYRLQTKREKGLSFVEVMVVIFIILVLLNSLFALINTMKIAKERAEINDTASKIYQFFTEARDESERYSSTTGVLFQKEQISYVKFTTRNPEVVKKYKMKNISIVPGSAFELKTGEAFSCDFNSVAYPIGSNAYLYVFKDGEMMSFAGNTGYSLPQYKGKQYVVVTYGLEMTGRKVDIVHKPAKYIEVKQDTWVGIRDHLPDNMTVQETTAYLPPYSYRRGVEPVSANCIFEISAIYVDGNFINRNDIVEIEPNSRIKLKMITSVSPENVGDLKVKWECSNPEALFSSDTNRSPILHVFYSKPGDLFKLTAGIESESMGSDQWELTIKLKSEGNAVFTSDKNSSLNEIYTMGIGEDEPKKVSHFANNCSYTTWSTDGEKIAFCRERTEGGPNDIWTMNSNGSALTRLTNSGYNDLHPSWSPAGNKIAFSSNRDRSKTDIYVMNSLDGSGLKRFTQFLNLNNVDPAWSPDGTKVLFSTGDTGIPYNLMTWQVGGYNTVSVTSTGYSHRNPAWSPDGARIAFESNRYGNREICIINADGSGEQRITNNINGYQLLKGDSTNPCWSRDGKKLIFSAGVEGSNHLNLYIINTDGTGLKKITNTTWDDKFPSWTNPGN